MTEFTTPAKKRRVDAQRSDVQKDAGGNGQDDQLRRSADAVDGEAAQPLLQIVAAGAEDEMLVAKEGNRNTNRLRGDRMRSLRSAACRSVGTR